MDAILIAQPGMFGADGGVIQTGADAVSELNLAVLVLKDVRASALQNAQRSALKTRGMFFGLDAFPSRFDAEHFDRSVFEEWIK